MKLKNLTTKFLGRNCFYYKTIDSTQREIYRRVLSGKIEQGTLVYADYQTNGVGTHGRKWYTDEKNNIAFSFYIKMNCDVKKINNLTKKIAEIILNIFDDKYNIKLEIKEPNDIYYNGKKIAGILTEAKNFSNIVKYIVVGIGINTNKENFCKEIRNIATSIKKEFNVIVDREEFITEFCNRFESKIYK